MGLLRSVLAYKWAAELYNFTLHFEWKQAGAGSKLGQNMFMRHLGELAMLYSSEVSPWSCHTFQY